MEGVFQVDYLTSAEQIIPGDWVKATSTFQGEAETIIRVGINSWFADMGLSISDSISGLLSPS